MLERAIYDDWWQKDAADKVSRYFDNLSNERPTVFVASGLLDPSLSADDLLKVNYHLPKNLIDGAATLGIKVITFGTVLEGLLRSKNSYIQSKIALGDYVQSIASNNRRVIHLQIHTLFGMGKPSQFMFLGQMLAAVRNHNPFKMTSGRQLREYHHLADEAKAIAHIEKLAPLGTINMSYGEPVNLRIIAESVFQALGKSELLRVGALRDLLEENYETIFKRAEILQSVYFRDLLPAIVRYMKQCYLSSEE